MKTVHLSESKSMANRLLILKSFLKEPLPLFRTQARDVTELRQALVDFLDGKTEFEISEGGTAFRFLLARISRAPGCYRVFAGERLLSRPHEPLYQSLDRLGVRVSLFDGGVELQSHGWQRPNEPLAIDCSKSTQFASAIQLSAVDLPFEFSVEAVDVRGSEPYWKMTQEMFIKRDIVQCEIDISSAFSVAAVAVVGGFSGSGVCLPELPQRSLQADHVFVDLLKKMGAQLQWFSESKDGESQVGLKVFSSKLSAIDAEISASPDLFPVLSMLCGLASGTSCLSGLESLPYKESDRLSKSLELLHLAGGVADQQMGIAKITGGLDVESEFTFDPDKDHRMAMAAAVLKAAGMKVKIELPEVVEKSFPGFWQAVEVVP